jgi:aryl-alcohol dehydrogenase-like predicted oxidoreductase
MSTNTNNRRDFIKKVALTASSLAIAPLTLGENGDEISPLQIAEKEWRNKQDGMEYRVLGKTGLMVSAMVVGGGGLNRNKYKFIGSAIERGVNYIDTAWRYGQGRSEEGVGEVLKMAGREKIFVCTKLSPYLPLIDQLSMDYFNALPSGKQKLLRDEAETLINNRGVNRSGYYYKFFAYQDDEIPQGYLTHVIRKHAGKNSSWNRLIKQEMMKAVEESLQRLGTDYIDILHCPHGARVPEELEDEAIVDTFDELKKQGKIRFTGLSIHTDVQGNLEKATELGYYDSAMVAYNIVNQGSMDLPIRKAYDKGMGIIAMKAASGVNPPSESLRPVPQWRIDKLNHAIPEEMKLPLKAYLWVLQNQHIAGVISAFANEEMIEENLRLIGRKIDFNYI